MLDKTTITLFSPFFREVGKNRQVIAEQWEFENFITRTDGIDECFTSVYPLTGVIDKIFFDIDKNEHVSDPKRVANKLINYAIDEKLTVIPSVSGKKGFHTYILLKGKIYKDPKDALTNAAHRIIFDSGIYKKQNGVYIPLVDMKLVGNVRGLCRIPNTLRPPKNLSYCTYVPLDFGSMKKIEIIRHMKSMHHYDYPIKKLPTLYDFEKIDIEFRSLIDHRLEDANVPDNVCRYLEPLLRPCLYKYIITRNPPHVVRLAVTLDLLFLDFTVNDVVDIFSKLNWADWDRDLTRDYVEQATKYKPYKCPTLRGEGIPEVCCIE